ncbi:hypothetical protein RJ639_047442 [Escallonia herrerae]|uniref:Uncharacterized protein n=1 Tax=Escallonia herrerae TaxID=1293975 RepID=A0AA89B1D1_9ASTE|nr:hypothetical protein RJ639_047442 [Escallonia herrerae]
MVNSLAVSVCPLVASYMTAFNHVPLLWVTWDELEVLQNVKRVSPWQVEYVVPTDSFHSTFPCTKKFRVSDDLGLLPDGDGEFFFPMTGLSSSMMGQLNPALINYVSFPAGMQGARQDQICVSRSSNFFSDNNHQMNMDDFVGNTMTKVDSVSTELNIGSSQSDNLSPDSQSSIHCFATELVGKQGCNSSTKVGFNSIQLFGKIIHMDEPVEGGFHDVGCTEDEGSRACKESEGLHNALDLSLTYPYAYDNLDVQYQRGSAIEACSS